MKCGVCWFFILFCLGRLYAMQKGMEIDRKSPDARQFLAGLMNSLEEVCNWFISIKFTVLLIIFIVVDWAIVK